MEVVDDGEVEGTAEGEEEGAGCCSWRTRTDPSDCCPEREGRQEETAVAVSSGCRASLAHFFSASISTFMVAIADMDRGLRLWHSAGVG